MNLDSLLRDASARLRASVDSDSTPEFARRRRSGALIAGLTAVGLVIVVGLVVLVSPTGNDDFPIATETTLPNSPTTASPSTTSTTVTSATVIPAVDPLFGETTDEVLVFDDGLSAVHVLDPDNRLIATVPIDGQRAGDQPYRIHRVGDHLVVGWGEIYAYSLNTGESTLIAKATQFVPAVEPERVWVVDWANGSNVGTGTPSAWQVDMEGNVLTEPTKIEGDVYPSIGIPGGLALETEHGIGLWYPGQGVTDAVLGMSSAIALDTWGDLLAYCTNWDCNDVRVVNLVNDKVAAEFSFEPPIRARSGRFSPDGTTLAFAVSTNDVVYLDIATGADVFAAKEVAPTDELVYVAWSPDSLALYAATYTYTTRPLTIVRHDLDTLATETTVLPFGGTLDFIVIDRSDAAVLLANAADL